METFSVLLVLCAVNSLVTGKFLSQVPVTRSFDVSFYLRLDKRSSKQSRRRWFETPSRSLWRLCNSRCHLRVPDLQMSCKNLAVWQGYDSNRNGCRSTCPIIEVHGLKLVSSDRRTYPLGCPAAGERYQSEELQRVQEASRWAVGYESSSIASKPGPKPQLLPPTPVSEPCSDDVTEVVVW